MNRFFLYTYRSMQGALVNYAIRQTPVKTVGKWSYAGFFTSLDKAHEEGQDYISSWVAEGYTQGNWEELK
jgi:hypothetical protein